MFAVKLLLLLLSESNRPPHWLTASRNSPRLLRRNFVEEVGIEPTYVAYETTGQPLPTFLYIVSMIGIEPIHNSRPVCLMRFPKSPVVSLKQYTNSSGILPIELHTHIARRKRFELLLKRFWRPLLPYQPSPNIKLAV